MSFRRLYSSLIVFSGLAAWQRWLLRHRITMVTYHGITASVFTQHVTFLGQAYRIIPLADALAALQGESAMPTRALVLTFDDGFRSFYEQIFPVLQQYQLPATVFLTTGYVGSDDILWFNWIDIACRLGAPLADILPPQLRELSGGALRRRLTPYLKALPDGERVALVEQIKQRIQAPGELVERYRLMTWEQAHEMQGSGLVSFGGHTMTHPILSRASLGKASAEINGCAADLERELGPAHRPFAYPNGEATDFNDAIKAMVRQAGFVCAVTALRGTCGPGDDLFALRRIAVDGSFSVAEVAAKLSGLWVHTGWGGA